MTACHDCGVDPDRPHVPGCDIERCTVCKGQRLQCECVGHDPWAARWTGEFPGKAECRERGWWAVRAPIGWRPVPAGTPGATEDLNRLAYFEMTGVDALYGADGAER